MGSGINGRDVTVFVPCGTTFRNLGSNEWEAPNSELITPGEREIQLIGGAGGRGNSHFKGNKKGIRLAEKGQKGQTGWFELELKTIVDVSIVGKPNTGKSSLLSVVSSSHPSVGHYAYTT